MLAAEHRDDLADDAHGRQDHDVHGRVRIEPEEVLIEHRVAAQGRVEDADAHDALDDQQQQRDAQHRRGQHLDDGRGVEGPQHQRHVEPAHARGAHAVDRDDEVEAGEHRTEAQDEGSKGEDRDMRIRGRAVGRVECPARIDAAEHDREHADQGADNIEMIAGEVESGQRHILRPEHQRQHEVAQRRWDARDDEQEDHDGAVQSEDLVVVVARHDRLALREQLGADHQGHDAADEEHRQDRRQVHHADALVVEGEEPRPEPAAAVQVVLRHDGGSHRGVVGRHREPPESLIDAATRRRRLHRSRSYPSPRPRRPPRRRRARRERERSASSCRR